MIGTLAMRCLGSAQQAGNLAAILFCAVFLTSFGFPFRLRKAARDVSRFDIRYWCLSPVLSGCSDEVTD